MKAARIHHYGPPEVVAIEEIPQPNPGPGELLIRVGAAGVGPWDALIREHKSDVKATLPIILGSDLAGIVEKTGSGVSEFKDGDEVYGAANPQFIGAYAEFAIAAANMVGRKPKGMSDVEAASVPVVAVTAWQMLFDYAKAEAGQTVLILGGAGNVGAYAVQLASHAGLQVIATASAKDAAYVKGLGAKDVLDYRGSRFEGTISGVDIVVDTVGGESRERSVRVLKPGGFLVSVVTPFPKNQTIPGIRTAFFYVEVTTARLNAPTEIVEHRKLFTQVGNVLPLVQVRIAHEMLGGASHERGKIVLLVNAALK